MRDKLANIISTVFHPVLMPFYGILLLFHLDYFFYFPFFYKVYVFSIVLVFTCIIPAFSIFLLYKIKYIESMRVEKREQRYPIYIISIVSYLVCLYILWKVNLPHWIMLISICSFFTIFVMAIINIWWKISIHAAAIGCFTGGMFLAAYFLKFNPVGFFIVVLLTGGLVMASRLQLKAHSVQQVICGYLLGISLVCFFPFLF